MEKLFIFGIGGLVGSKLAKLASTDFEVFGSYNFRKNDEFSSIKLDVSETNKVKKILEEIEPKYIINTTAIHNVDYCENHKDETREINVEFVKNLFQISENLGSKLVHISTDSIFDGQKLEPYTENDVPNPPNYYGETKLESENITLQNKNNLVIRASILYGWLNQKLAEKESSSKKSINFAQWLINTILENKTVNIITDEKSSPILAEDFSRSILHLIKKNLSGIYHSAPPIEITRHEFSVKLIEFLGLDTKLINPITNKELGRKVNTGQNKCLNSKRLQETGYQFMSLEESFSLIKDQSNI